MSFAARRDRTLQTHIDSGRRADMLRPFLNLRIQPEPTRPARDVIIDARRRARRELVRTWD
jgi:hypothetical protein